MMENFTYCDWVSIEEEKKSAFINREIKKKNQLNLYEDVVVCPWAKETEHFHGEVINKDGSIIDNVCSGTQYESFRNKRVTIPNDCETVEEAIYLGCVCMCWGHYITDGLSKLWCLQDPSFLRLVKKGVPIYFTSEWEKVETMPSAWKYLIDLLGGEQLNISPLQQNTKFKYLYVPTNTIQHTVNGRFYSISFKQLIDLLRERAIKTCHNNLPRYEKIYLSRTKFSHDHCEFGELAIERTFKKVGFHILYPEQLTFEQQVWYLYHAKEVASTMGSISHNFMFCSSNTRVYILRKAWYTNDFQYVVNQVSKLNAYYIDCHLSVFIDECPNSGPFYMYLNNNLIKFFKDNYDICVKENFNRRLFMNYLIKCLQRPNFQKRNGSPQYYYMLMTDMWNSHPTICKKIYTKITSLLGRKYLDTIVRQVIMEFMR